jgi:hypothetical protein
MVKKQNASDASERFVLGNLSYDEIVLFLLSFRGFLNKFIFECT